MDIAQFKKSSFSSHTSKGHLTTHDLYEIGEGKVCVIMQELPGITPEALRLAQMIAEKEYRVVLTHFFGPVGSKSPLNFFRVMCMRKEFRVWARNESSPIVDWLKALCRHLKEKHQVKGVGVIGMCLSGNFAISLMAEESVLAAYASQPSMPFFFNQKSMHMSDTEIDSIKTRLDNVGPMHCKRFEKDIICQANKLKSIDIAFNTDGKQRIILETLPGGGHAILTRDFVNEEGHPTRKAFDEVMDYFDERLA